MEVCFDSVSFRFGTPGGFRLLVPSLALESGRHAAILGPSGSGKSTLLNLAAGILAPTEGRIRAGGHDLHDLSASERRRFRQHHVGYLFQDLALLDYLNVVENVLLPYRLRPGGRPSGEDRQSALDLLGRMGLATEAHRAVTRLSRGERQRVALCRALVSRPRILLADEPTASLDPDAKHEAIRLLRDGAGDLGATLVVVTHDATLTGGFDHVWTMGAITRGEVSA